LKAPPLPQSPSTKKLREASCLEECENLRSCADAEREEREEVMKRVRRKEMDMVKKQKSCGRESGSGRMYIGICMQQWERISMKEQNIRNSS